MMYDGLNHLCGNAKNSGTNAEILHAHIGGELRLVAEQLTNLEMLRLGEGGRIKGPHLQTTPSGCHSRRVQWLEYRARRGQAQGFFIEDSLFPRNPLTKKQFCAFRIRTINWRFAPDDRTVLE
jgi:hypothetical protein